MTKAEAKKLKPGDSVRIKGGRWEIVSKVEETANGYSVFLEHITHPVRHKVLESNKERIKEKRKAFEKELEEYIMKRG